MSVELIFFFLYFYPVQSVFCYPDNGDSSYRNIRNFQYDYQQYVDFPVFPGKFAVFVEYTMHYSCTQMICMRTCNSSESEYFPMFILFGAGVRWGSATFGGNPDRFS